LKLTNTYVEIEIGMKLDPQSGWPQEASRREAMVRALNRKDLKDLEETICLQLLRTSPSWSLRSSRFIFFPLFLFKRRRNG